MNYRKLLGSILVFLFVFQCAGVYAETEQVTYVHTDHLGSPILGRDANGQTVFEYDYRSYGARDVSQGEAGFVGYTGHGQSDDSGLLYARARWMDPEAGRFLSPDPVRFDEGGVNHFNDYSYTYSNPYNNTDPTGEIADKAVIVVGIIIAGREIVKHQIKKAIKKRARKKVGESLGGQTQKTGNKADGASDTLKPGPFAKESIPARGGGRNFSKGERDVMNNAGRKDGCHTCGTKDPGTKSGNFIPDHQPSTALNSSSGPQRLYPHCKGCSGRQAGQVTQAKRRLNQ